MISLISKSAIHDHCLRLLQDKCLYIQQSIADAREAGQSDTKSSMGDKYETTREMMQIEINKLHGQLAEMQQQLLAIKVLDPNKKCTVAEPGAIVETDKAVFYLAAPLGKISLDGTTYMVVSPSSPIGKKLLQHNIGNHFDINGVSYTIQTIT